jgi:hypothetical protein
MGPKRKATTQEREVDTAKKAKTETNQTDSETMVEKYTKRHAKKTAQGKFTLYIS